MQKVRTAEEIILKLRKIAISINHEKSIRIEEGITRTTSGVENTAA